MKFFQEQSKYKKKKGFSLVEVMVAISLLLIALVGPMTFYTRSSQSTEVANDRVIATFFAQEGAELVQKIRDDAVLADFFDVAQDGWGNFLNIVDDCLIGSCGLSVGENGGVNVIDCGSSSCALRYDSSASHSRFTHDSQAGIPTNFSRYIELRQVSNREVEIVSRVEWDTTVLRNRPSVEVKTSVFNIFAAE